MRKLLLLALATICLQAAAAQVEITMADFTKAAGNTDETISWTTQGITLTFDQADGAAAPTLNSSTQDMRVYAKGTVTIAASEKITEIAFSLSAQGLKRATEITTSTGKIAEQGANPLVWTGDAKSITFTVGEKATYGTDSKKAGQLAFDKLTITLNGEGGGEGPGTDPGDQPGTDPTPNPGNDDAIYSGLTDNADDWELYTLWPLDEDYEPIAEIWKWDSKFGLKASGYFDKAAQETEAYAISPWIDLTEYTDCKLTFDHALNYLDTSKYDIDWYLGVDACDEEADAAAEDEEAGIYLTLSVPTWPKGTDWNFVNSGEIDLSDFDGKRMYVLLYYYSGPTEEQTNAYEDGTIDEDDLVNVAGTWEVKNFVITGVDKAGVRQVIADTTAPVEYYNLNGMRINNPGPGLYIVRRGNKVSKTIIR